MNREGTATAGGDVWPQLADKLLSRVALRL